ncbi:MAG: hypothetical protein ACOX9A_16320 [Anaerolineae bacterium]|jgi:hypothetical protein
MKNRMEIILFALLMVVLVSVEWLCARLAYWTLGEVTSFIYKLAVVGLNLVVIIVAARNRPVASTLAMMVALLIIPYQMMLGDRLLRVRAEAAGIVAYAYEYRIETGGFPTDLRGYTFRDRAMEPFIQHYERRDEQGGFFLGYRVGTVNTSHSYSPAYGWSYYPD